MPGYFPRSLLRESCLVLVVHRYLGVAWRNQSFFRPNSNYPLIHRSLLGLLKLVELRVPSLCILEERLWMVNLWTQPFTEN